MGRSTKPHSAGLRVSALIDESTVADAIVIANCEYSRPVMPPIMATGTNTASRTSVVATTGPATCSIALAVAACGGSPSSSISRFVFSTTTMASSTTIPIASTSPNRVNVLIDMPRADITAKVPSSETGIVTAGTSVVRRSCRNR